MTQAGRSKAEPAGRYPEQRETMAQCRLWVPHALDHNDVTRSAE